MKNSQSRLSGSMVRDTRPTGANDNGTRPPVGVDAAELDALAGSLRERLLRDAGEGGGDLVARIRALVDSEAAALDEGARTRPAAAVAQRSFGLGPLEPLLGDPAVNEVMVNGPSAVWVERGGGGGAGGGGVGPAGGPRRRGQAGPPP